MRKSVEEMSKDMTREEFITFVTENDLWPMDFDLPDDESEEAWDKALVGIEFKAAVPVLPKEITPALKQLQELEIQAAQIEKIKKNLKEDLLKAMEKHGVKKWDNEVMTITYTAPTTRTSIDSNKLKKDLPEIYAKYCKTSNVKSSIRIKLKGEK
ncbi:hypothetical protein C7M79_13870 [Clostridium botulinum]|uniref:hypothetical protein n=1 Tax=Clostridium botulinum TaxID=1491 RepID=UPI000D22C50A|nr:hypothetical protein C7M79_13870 [Clostridium botulinum]